MSSFDEYDVSDALEGADSFDVGQAIGYAGEESLRAVGNLLGNDTGTAIADTVIDAVDAGAQTLVELVSDWF